MIELQDIRPGNWFIDKRDGNYCTIVQIGPPLKLQRFGNESYIGELWCLRPIEISSGALSVIGFRERPNDFVKLVNGEEYRLFKVSIEYYRLKSATGKIIHAQYVHELQNGFQDLSGDQLQFNLFGI
jgi:hypothetical protein